MRFVPGARATAPMAGARVSHRPRVTSIEVRHQKGRMPMSALTMPAKIINSHALMKDSGPAAKKPGERVRDFLR